MLCPPAPNAALAAGLTLLASAFIAGTTARAANQSWSVFIRLFSNLCGVFMASEKVGFTCVKVAFRPLIVWLGRGYFNVCIDSVYSAV